MSLKTKLASIFSLVVIIILLLNNTMNYFVTRDILIKDQEIQMELLAKEISTSIEHSQIVTQYVEDLIGEKLRTAAVAAQSSLSPDIEKVENDELVALSKTLGVSHITLFKQVGDNIVALKSSDPKEIGLGTKEWKYWFEAFKQLFRDKNVTIPEGQKLPNYWSGPIDVSSSNNEARDKWGYYHDGTTNYIINPYVRVTEIDEFTNKLGPEAIILKSLRNNKNIIEITGFNPKAFGEPPIYTTQNGNTFIELANRDIQFGNYTYNNIDVDASIVKSSAETEKVASYIANLNGKKILKTFVPIHAKVQYVVGIITDYSVIEEELDKELLRNLIISIIVLILVLIGSYFFADYIVRPIKCISEKVNEIAKGSFGAQIIMNRKDELGLLINSVNIMSRNLENHTKELQEKNAKIEYQAYHDHLTGLPNLRLFNKRIKKEQTKAKQKNTHLAVFFIDLDHFKFINDMYGHSIGDYVIKCVAERIAETLSKEELLARIGGDEFILLLPNCDRESASEKAQILLNALQKPYYYQDNELFVTPSIGASLYPVDSDDIDTVVKNADIAMYRAKEQGRDNFEFFTADMNEIIYKRSLLEGALRKAIERDELELYYQPQIDLVSGALVGNEALIRWNHTELGVVPPIEFIPLAEDIGLISSMGEWILRTACKQNVAWQQSGLKDLRVSVNLSALQFKQKNLFDVISQVLKDTGLAPQYLELEITESVAMYNEEQVISKLQALKNLGVKIAIDDFGTGYSSLNYLKKFPIDKLKIDKSFVSDITNDNKDAQIITAIIAMAQNLKFSVIAEGVETEEQLAFLLKQQCNEAQGYLFSKALPVHELNQMLHQIQEKALELTA